MTEEENQPCGSLKERSGQEAFSEEVAFQKILEGQIDCFSAAVEER